MVSALIRQLISSMLYFICNASAHGILRSLSLSPRMLSRDRKMYLLHPFFLALLTRRSPDYIFCVAKGCFRILTRVISIRFIIITLFTM